MTAPDKLSIIVFSGQFERVHYALVTASAAAAIDKPVTLFFTMGAISALLAETGDHRPGWAALDAAGGPGPIELDGAFAKAGVATFEELMAACVELGVRFMVCEMGLRAAAITVEELRADVKLTPGGVVSFLNDASSQGAMLFV